MTMLSDSSLQKNRDTADHVNMRILHSDRTRAKMRGFQKIGVDPCVYVVLQALGGRGSGFFSGTKKEMVGLRLILTGLGLAFWRS